MRGGQNRKPDAKLALEGTFRPDRHGDPETKVEFSDGVMEPPAGMSDAGKREWFRISPILREAGLLKPAYRLTIIRYCELSGLAEDMGAGFKHDSELRQYIAMLGLCPQAASRIVVGKKKPKQGKFSDV